VKLFIVDPYAGDFYVIPTKKKNYAPVEKTGENVSHSGAGHDDGDLQKGVAWPIPRFTDNNNGTVTDNLTGLVWLKNANCAGVTVDWQTAVDSAFALYDGCVTCFENEGDCGLSDGSSAGDWRLPNIKELLSLISYGRSDPALPNLNPFTGVQFDYYWSSTSNDVIGSFAWCVRFDYGSSTYDAYTNKHYVWPVRDGQ